MSFKLLPELNNCNRCLLSKKRLSIVPGRGNVGAKIFILGEGPGKEEERTALPFIGPAGKELVKILRLFDFDLKEDIYLSNCVRCRCRSPKGSVFSNARPTDEQIDSCSIYWKKEIELIKPKVIVGLGQTAIKALLNIKGKVRVGEYIGLHNYNNIPIILAYHPATILYSTNSNSSEFYKRNLYNSFKIIERLIN